MMIKAILHFLHRVSAPLREKNPTILPVILLCMLSI